MTETIAATLRAAGFTDHHVTWSIYETTVDGVKPDMSDWMVRHPDFAAPFARGKVEFILSLDDNGAPALTKGYTDPTWGDVLVAAELSCRARGAPELDHIFLEAVEPEGPRRKGVTTFAFHWGS